MSSNNHHNTRLALAENVREENASSASAPVDIPREGNGPDLDDHRQQHSLPRSGTHNSRTRRRSTGFSQSSGRGEASEPPHQLILEGGTIARDFESAVVDDNASVTTGGHSVRQLSGSPVFGRRSTFRRQRNKSRDSASSRGSSPSPPTSVHAFAERRRRGRSNTANTTDQRALSDLPGLHTTSSNDGFPRRRLTFSDNPTGNDAESTSTDTSIENDVCYPQSDHPEEGPDIDFEELEEFVAEEEAGQTTGHLTVPTTPATVPLESINTDIPALLPSPMIKPQDDEDAFDDLEKIKNSANQRLGLPGAPRPFFTFFSTESEDTIHANSLGGLLADDESFKNLFSVQGEDGSWWLDVVRPSEEEVTVLCKAFGVHPLTREDICTQEFREKVELFRHYYFVGFHSFETDSKDEEYLEPIHFYAVVFRQGLLTFSYSSTPHTGNVLRRISRLRDYMSISGDWICYALIDDIVDTFMPVIRGIETEVDTIEDGIFTARAEDARSVLGQIGECRKKVMSLLRLLGGKSDVIKGFAKRCNEKYSVAPTGDVGLYLSDIQDHILTMRDNLSHSEQLLSRVHTNFLAQINVDNIDAGNKTNEMLGKVTLLATILVPMNLVTGMFGMNVPVPGKDSGGLGWFFGIVGSIAAFAVICLVVFKKLKLI